MQIVVALHADSALNTVLAAETIALVSRLQQVEHLRVIVAIVVAHPPLGLEALPAVERAIVERILGHRHEWPSQVIIGQGRFQERAHGQHLY